MKIREYLFKWKISALKVTVDQRISGKRKKKMSGQFPDYPLIKTTRLLLWLPVKLFRLVWNYNLNKITNPTKPTLLFCWFQSPTFDPPTPPLPLSSREQNPPPKLQSFLFPQWSFLESLTISMASPPEKNLSSSEGFAVSENALISTLCNSIQALGRGFDVTSDIRLLYCKGAPGSRLVNIDEDRTRNLQISQSYVIPNVSVDIECSTGKTSNERTHVCNFLEVTLLFLLFLISLLPPFLLDWMLYLGFANLSFLWELDKWICWPLRSIDWFLYLLMLFGFGATFFSSINDRMCIFLC